MIRTPAARSVFSRKFVIWRESGGWPTLPFVKQTEGAPSFAFFEDSLSKNKGFFSGEVQENLSFKRPRPLPGV
jgi:hypothetical protein